MRNLHIPSRSPVYGRKAMVATSHPEASLRALEMISKGGNAIDAAVAAAAVLGVVEAHSTGLGGDCFCLFYSNKVGKVISLNGSGNVSKVIDYNQIKQTNDGYIDPYTAHAITIPGAVAAWDKLINDYGNFSFKDVLAPAIHLAENGYVVADVIADMWKREETKLRKDEDCKRIFLKDNEAYKVGDIHIQSELVDT